MAAENYILGVDVGGTFTDLAIVRLSDGQAFFHKTSSTPDDPSRAIVTGIEELLADTNVEANSILYFGHGTTVATNALITGRTARTGLITTKGFRDILEIRRQRQPHRYAILMPKPDPTVPRHLRREMTERTHARDLEPTAPNLTELDPILSNFAAEGVEAIAICFLHSYRNPAHELAIADHIREKMPDIFVCPSHQVLNEFREYERVSTTSLNAALGPVMSVYLEQLEDSARSLGVVAPKILQSNGGVASVSEVANNPVRTLASGPAAGVTGAAYLANKIDQKNVITFDVGGTSTDVCLIEKGEPLDRREREFNGHPIRFPMMNVHSVGAGGGSIAWVDEGGFLHVGPQSAGARPGPACYGFGGEEPTVTDANVVLGRLSQEALLGGRMAIDVDLARKVITEKVAEPMNMSLEDAAEAILTLLNESMMQAIRVITVEQGFDPRHFGLVAFGGAGPLLASPLARDLDLSTIMVPPGPGLLCALGLLVADVRSDFSHTKLANVDEASLDALNAAFDEVTETAEQWFEREKVPSEQRVIERAADMRYQGQSHELTVPVPTETLTAENLPQVIDTFTEEHDRVYGYAPGGAVQMVTFRIVARASITRPPALTAGSAGEDVASAQTGIRKAYFKELKDYVDCPVYDRDRLPKGSRFDGPAICEQMDTTTVLLPNQQAEVDGDGNLILTFRQ